MKAALTRKTFIAGLALAGVVFATGAAFAEPAAHVGKPAPAFSATDMDGKTRSLSEFAGKTVILEWTNHECPYVRKHYGSGTMQTLQKDMTKEGIVWLTVISSAPGEQGYADGATARQLTASRDASPTDVLLDPKSTLGRTYGAQTTPHMYIVDPKGILVYAGAIDDKPSSNPASLNGAKSYVRQAIAEMQAGKSISEPVTKSYGCSMKFAPVT